MNPAVGYQNQNPRVNPTIPLSEPYYSASGPGQNQRLNPIIRRQYPNTIQTLFFNDKNINEKNEKMKNEKGGGEHYITTKHNMRIFG